MHVLSAHTPSQTFPEPRPNLYTVHVGFKKVYLEFNWQIVRYLHKIGAVESYDRAYLPYAVLLTCVTMYGRMMQVMAENPRISSTPTLPTTLPH